MNRWCALLCCALIVATASAGCADDGNVCDCSFGVCDVGLWSGVLGGSCPTLGVCDVIPGLNTIQNTVNDLYSEADDLASELAPLTDELNQLVTDIQAFSQAVADIPGYVEDFGDNIAQLLPLVEQLKEYTLVLMDPIEKFVDVFRSIPSFENLDEMLLGRLQEAAQYLVDWLFNTLLVPGVYKAGDCWDTSLENGDIGFGSAFSTDPGVSVTMTITNLNFIDCFLGFSDAFEANLKKKMSVLPDWMDFTTALRSALSNLDDSLAVAEKSLEKLDFLDTFCELDLPEMIQIPDPGNPDWVSDVVQGVNTIASIGAVNGPIGKPLLLTIDAVCQVRDIPHSLRNFTDRVVDYLETFNPDVLETMVTKLFNAIDQSISGWKTITDVLSTADCPENATESSDLKCTASGQAGCLAEMYQAGNLAFTFSLGLSFATLPPVGIKTGYGFGCSSLDCYSCITGFDVEALVADGQVTSWSSSSTQRTLKADASSSGDLSTSYKMIFGDVLKFDSSAFGKCSGGNNCAGTYDSVRCTCTPLGDDTGAIVAGVLVPLIIIGGAAGAIYALKVKRPGTYSHYKGKLIDAKNKVKEATSSCPRPTFGSTNADTAAAATATTAAAAGTTAVAMSTVSSSTHNEEKKHRGPPPRPASHSPAPSISTASASGHHPHPPPRPPSSSAHSTPAHSRNNSATAPALPAKDNSVATGRRPSDRAGAPAAAAHVAAAHDGEGGAANRTTAPAPFTLKATPGRLKLPAQFTAHDNDTNTNHH